MTEIRLICVYCGASPGDDPAYLREAEAFGRLLAESGIRLIYGGGRLGVMGAVAKSCFAAGGEVVGIIPTHLMKREHAFLEITELKEVEDMHTRKKTMCDIADAICVMPGGLGTMDETFEIITWKQLGLHHKPVILANIAGFFDLWRDFVHVLISRGFARPENASLFQLVDTAEAILPAMNDAMMKREER